MRGSAEFCQASNSVCCFISISAIVKPCEYSVTGKFNGPLAAIRNHVDILNNTCRMNFVFQLLDLTGILYAISKLEFPLTFQVRSFFFRLKKFLKFTESRDGNA